MWLVLCDHERFGSMRPCRAEVRGPDADSAERSALGSGWLPVPGSDGVRHFCPEHRKAREDMSRAEGIEQTLTDPMRRTLRMAYQPDPATFLTIRWRIPPYAHANTVRALQRRGLADGWLLTADGIIVRGLVEQ